MTKVYSVVFKENGKCYNFKSDASLNKDEKVIVDTENGLQLGKVNGEVDNVNFSELKDVIRIATDEDYNLYLEHLKEAQEARLKCIEFVKQLDLKMNVLSARFAFDKTQLLFDFTADDRVDFRELAKKLASIYHTRIELRQIGARDKAKKIGGVGICGQELCCKRYLNKMDGISMTMAKNQNLALNPSKINGSCGRLMCCLAYEEDAYEQNIVGMPQIGHKINTPKGEGQVISVDILQRKYKVLVDGNKEEFYVE